MRISLILFLALFASSLMAKPMNVQEFQKLSLEQQVEVLIEYKKFVSEFKEFELEDKVSLFSFDLFTKAWASGNFSCFYAGWPSETRKVTSTRTVCTNPANVNSHYKKVSQDNKCKGTEMACNPVLFGTGLCVSTATQTLRNRAFAQCEQKFVSEGRSLSEVAQAIASGTQGAEAEEMFALVNNVCSKGFQSSTAMCRNLEKRVAQIQEAIPETPVAPKTAERPQADKAKSATAKAAEADTKEKMKNEVIVSSGGKAVESDEERKALITAVQGAEEIQDAVQHTHGPECEESHGARQPAQSKPKPPVPDSMKKVRCEKPQPRSQDRSPQELERILRENNVKITTAPISDVNLVWDFVAQMELFPESLRRELASAGAKIHIFEDNEQYSGVTADPSWRSKSLVEAKDGRRWASIPGSGGFVPNGYAAVPTRIVLNKLHKGHGATHLFLHEHAHTLNTRFGANKPLHSSSEFKALKQNPNWREFMKNLCVKDYCANDDEEAFAELFAYYHGCDASRQHLEKHLPEVAEYFRNLTTLNGR